MTRGVVFFAFNNDSVDYIKLAKWAARRVNHYLDLPCSLITDRRSLAVQGFDRVLECAASSDHTRWFADSAVAASWYNYNRYKIYELTPYDQTLLLDVDYVVCSNYLNHVWSHPAEIVCAGTAFDVTGLNNFDEHNYFGRIRMPSAWATVIKFERGILSQTVFDIMHRVQDNWDHYRNLYGIRQRHFRNDFALAIAMHVAHGQTATWPKIPGSLATVTPEHSLKQIENNSFEVLFQRPSGSRGKVVLSGIDFHAMGKTQLGTIVDNSV